jgi:hypothetical protein
MGFPPDIPRDVCGFLQKFLDLLPAFYSEEHAQPHSWFSRRKFQVPTYLEYFTCRRSKPGLACQSHFPAKPYIFSCLGAKSCQHFRHCNDRSTISKIFHFSSFSHALPIFQALCLLVSIGRQSSTRVHSYAAKRLNSFRRSLLPQHLPKRVGVRLLLFKLNSVNAEPKCNIKSIEIHESTG